MLRVCESGGRLVSAPRKPVIFPDPLPAGADADPFMAAAAAA